MEARSAGAVQMVLEEIAFTALAGAAVLTAFGVVRSREVTHSAIMLVMSFGAIGGVFFLLNAELLGIIQLLVYAGAITVLMLFAIMLTKRTIMGEQEREDVPGLRAGELRKYEQEKTGQGEAAEE
ncbi:MAG TPA: NADH-quinone oxidoreductase subunit J [Thermoplasmata archaeon]|nr:NADH-quinone oxidoreductase subunit J [Thermoplasmata archaeon]